MKLSYLFVSPIHFVFFSTLVLSGCTAFPTTVGFDEDDNEYFSESPAKDSVAVKTETQDKVAEVVVAPAATVEKLEEQNEVVIEQRETFSSSKGYWRAAIKYLQVGDESSARWALERALLLNPKSKIANALLIQINSDVIAELGSSYFEYQVKYGDSLSKIAKKYLDDPLKFYLLAKYNQIKNPGKLVTGQILRIPGDKAQDESAPVSYVNVAWGNKKSNKNLTKKSSSAKHMSALQSTGSELLLDAHEMLSAGEYSSTIELIENHVADASEKAELQVILIKAYYEEATDLIQQQEIAEAKVLLVRAVEIEPDNAEVNMLLIDLSEVDQFEDLYGDSVKALTNNDPIKAYELINQAIAIQADNEQILEKKQEIKKALIEYYYKQALMAQRKHKLDAAIEYWDKVLELDESNNNANMYRVKAVFLKIKLNQFVSSR